MTDTDDHYHLGRVRARLINDRLLELFDIRMKCERVHTLNGDVPTKHRLALHNAIRDVYLAIRPLRHEPALNDYWTTTTLSPEWGDWQHVPPDHDHATPLAKTRDGDTIHAAWTPHTGLDTLDDLHTPLETTTETRPVFGGTKTETRTEPNPLPYSVLLDITTVLEDAAEKLGFVPDVRESKPRTEITQDMLKEVQQWHKKHVK